MAKKNVKVKPIDHERMLECIREIKSMEQTKRELESEIKECKKEVQAVMTEHGLEEMVCDVFTVRFMDVVSQRVDCEALKEQYRSIYEKLVKPVVSKRFTIS